MSENSNDRIMDLPADEPPKSGEFVEHDDLVLTPEEMQEGRHLGETIDTENDEDGGDIA